MNHPHILSSTDQSNEIDPKNPDLSDDLPHVTVSKWSLDELHSYVANTLEVEQDDIDIADNLLEWGMNSLALMRLTTELNKDDIGVGLDELLAEPSLVQWFNLIMRKQNQPLHPSPVVNTADITPIEDTFAAFPLTDVQLAYWLGRNNFFELGGVGAHGYIEVNAKGICPERLANALNQTIRANPMLRAVVNDDGEQRVLAEVPDYDLIVHKTESRSAESIRASMEHEVISADTWPLFNICMSEQGTDKYLIHISFDILIFDLKSLELWVSKWWEFYRDPAAIPTPSEYGFQDYVLQQSQQSAAAHESRKYWEDRVPNLPLGPTIPLVKSTETLVPKFARVQQVIPKATWDLLQQTVQQSGAMPSSLLLAAYAKILATWGETQHFCLTMTLFNRDMTGLALDQVIGDFTSLFILEADARESQGFMHFVKKLQHQMLQDLNHKVVSGVEVLGKMAEHHKTPNKAMLPFVFTSTLGTGRSYLDAFSHFGNITKAAVQTPQVLIDHQTLEHEGNLVLNWDYVLDAFPQGLVEEMAQSHCRLLTLLAESAEAWLDPHLSLLPEAQQEARKKYNDTKTTFSDTSRLLHEPFLRQVKRNPSAIALVNNGLEISYEVLNRSSNIIAAELLSLGVGVGKIAAVVMDKGWQQIVSILGILKSGAAYLPIDASQPLKRIEVLLGESDASAVILEIGSVINTQHQSAEWPFIKHKILIDNNLLKRPFTGSTLLLNQAKAQDLAYVIFTSGSTGKPKGVMLSHRAALNTVLDVNQRYEVTADDSCLMVSSLSFDLSVYDIFGLLGVGGKVVIPTSSILPEPSDWLTLVTQYQVTVWNSAPALFQIFYDHLKDMKKADVIQTMHTILLSADWLNVACCAELRQNFPGVRLVSMGGATEAAIWSIGYDIKTVDPKWPSIPYGEAMANQRLYVLNKQLQNTPDWVPGELYIAGVGLAEGYWEDPIKTQTAFIDLPQTDERIYRTGDWARMLPSGVIELLGRQDNQVKINGVRVELGEIEVCLEAIQSIEQAIVVARRSKNQGDQLVAFIVSERGRSSLQQATELEKVERWLTDRLPQTLVPKVIKFLPNLPLSSNGKVNRGALVAQAQATLNQIVENRVSATTDLQFKLTEIWEELLSRKVQDVSSNFFALGGSSLLATRLAGKINTEFNTSIAVIKIFEHSSIEGQAALLESELNSALGVVSQEAIPASIPISKRRRSGSKRKAVRHHIIEQ